MTFTSEHYCAFIVAYSYCLLLSVNSDKRSRLSHRCKKRRFLFLPRFLRLEKRFLFCSTFFLFFKIHALEIPSKASRSTFRTAEKN